MTTKSFAFAKNNHDQSKSDELQLEKFVTMCVLRGYDFEVRNERISSVCVAVIVTVDDIDDADADSFHQFIEDDDDEDDDYDEPYQDDLEMGFNPYMGCYDYDC